MATLLLAVAGRPLASLVQRCLEQAGHTTVTVRRPLAILTEAKRTAWHVVVIDGSALGRDALVVLGGVDDTPIIGLGFQDLRLTRSLALPLDVASLTEAVETLTGLGGPGLVLRPEQRIAQANGREVRLTDTEFRLLETLMARRPDAVPIDGVMTAIWGAPVKGTPAPLRSHVRNLRSKLAQIGLPNALRSRRGRGYLLAV